MIAEAATIETPLGESLAAATDKGIVSLTYDRERPGEVLDKLAGAVGPLRRGGRRLEPVRRQLDKGSWPPELS